MIERRRKREMEGSKPCSWSERDVPRAEIFASVPNVSTRSRCRSKRHAITVTDGVFLHEDRKSVV